MATVKEIKEALAAIESLDDARWQAYESDSRAGIQKAIQQRKKKLFKRILMKTYAWKICCATQKELYQQGYQAIAGIDEVGRGPLAGPVVTACVIHSKKL